MTGTQYVALAYVFAGTVLFSYAIGLWWAFPPSTATRDGSTP
jgi:hypothetical protein